MNERRYGLKTLIGLIAVGLAFAGRSSVAEGQAQVTPFDCAKASGQIENLICKDSALATLDRRMTEVYATALKQWPALSYRTRIVQLQIESGQLTAPTPVGYTCTGGPDEPFTVSFYKSTDPASAVITHGNGQVIAPRSTPAPAAANRRPLGNTSWILEVFQSSDDTTLRPGEARYTLTFSADGSLTVQADCNRGKSTWRSTDNVTLTFGDVALTRASCPPSPLQNRFVRDLAYVRSYVIQDGRLHLSLMADGGIYTFRPAADASR